MVYSTKDPLPPLLPAIKIILIHAKIKKAPSSFLVVVVGTLNTSFLPHTQPPFDVRYVLKCLPCREAKIELQCLTPKFVDTVRM